jgi:hypothetical protein
MSTNAVKEVSFKHNSSYIFDRYGKYEYVKNFFVSKTKKNAFVLINTAISYGHLEVIQFALSKFNFFEKVEEFAGKAANQNKFEILKFLIDEYGCCDFELYGNYAARYNNVNMLEYLISIKGLEDYNKALCVAATYGSVDCVKFLTEKSIKLNYGNALVFACGSGNIEIVNLLGGRCHMTHELFSLCFEAVQDHYDAQSKEKIINYIFGSKFYSKDERNCVLNFAKLFKVTARCKQPDSNFRF